MEHLEVFDCSNILIACYFNDDRGCAHENREHTLIYLCSGELEIEERGKKTVLHPGECAFMRRDNRMWLHKKVENGKPYRSIVLKFSRPFLRDFYRSLDNRLTHGLTITEVHTIVAVGLHEQNPMNVVAARLGVTLATLTTAVNKLVRKGFVERIRAEDDRRKVLVSLTKKGRQVFRAHNVFHRQMIDEALADLTEEEEQAFAAGLAKVKRFFDGHA